MHCRQSRMVILRRAMAIGQHPAVQFLMVQRQGEWQCHQAKRWKRLVNGGA